MILKINIPIIVSTSLVVLLLIAGWFGYDSLINRPQRIQMDLIGKPIGHISNLRGYDPGSMYFGEGRERWTYALVEGDVSLLSRTCKDKIFDTCDLAVKDDAVRNVQYAVRMNGNVLIVEAWYL
ncbi:MAG: hypothetical protein V4564_23175 [Pseudomonadota bacterium]